MEKTNASGSMTGTDRHLPGRVPEKYFENLKTELSRIPHDYPMGKTCVVPVSVWSKVRPYFALAASFLIILTVGAFVVRLTGNVGGEWSESDYIEALAVTEPYWLATMEEYDSSCSENISSDDIIDYLIESNVSNNHIEYVQEYE